ncbi:MAG: hypothetical protein LBD16_01170 [Oscillospiraceae bacterium]|nr:hypothetical protein [Oscillospiraceae bacterium]
MIELLEKGKRKLYFDRLLGYGNAIRKIMVEKDIEIILVLTRENKREFIHDYSDILEHKIDVDGREYLELKKSVKNASSLKKKTRPFMSSAWIKAFTCQEAVDILLEEAA